MHSSFNNMFLFVNSTPFFAAGLVVNSTSKRRIRSEYVCGDHNSPMCSPTHSEVGTWQPSPLPLAWGSPRG